MLVRMKGRMPYWGWAAVESHTGPKRKAVRPICRMAGMPEITRYTVISSTQPTVTSPRIRKMPWMMCSSSCLSRLMCHSFLRLWGGTLPDAAHTA